eukprot:gene12112-12251_t
MARYADMFVPPSLEDDESDEEICPSGTAAHRAKPRRKSHQRPQGSDQVRQAFSKRKKGLVLKAYQLSALTDAKVFMFIVNDKGTSWAYATPGFPQSLNPELLKELRVLAQVPEQAKIITEVMPDPPIVKPDTTATLLEHPALRRADQVPSSYIGPCTRTATGSTRSRSSYSGGSAGEPPAVMGIAMPAARSGSTVTAARLHSAAQSVEHSPPDARERPLSGSSTVGACGYRSSVEGHNFLLPGQLMQQVNGKLLMPGSMEPSTPGNLYTVMGQHAPVPGACTESPVITTENATECERAAWAEQVRNMVASLPPQQHSQFMELLYEKSKDMTSTALESSSNTPCFGISGSNMCSPVLSTINSTAGNNTAAGGATNYLPRLGAGMQGGKQRHGPSRLSATSPATDAAVAGTTVTPADGQQHLGTAFQMYMPEQPPSPAPASNPAALSAGSAGQCPAPNGLYIPAVSSCQPVFVPAAMAMPVGSGPMSLFDAGRGQVLVQADFGPGMAYTWLGSAEGAMSPLKRTCRELPEPPSFATLMQTEEVEEDAVAWAASAAATDSLKMLGSFASLDRDAGNLSNFGSLPAFVNGGAPNAAGEACAASVGGLDSDGGAYVIPANACSAGVRIGPDAIVYRPF